MLATRRLLAEGGTTVSADASSSSSAAAADGAESTAEAIRFGLATVYDDAAAPAAGPSDADLEALVGVDARVTADVAGAQDARCAGCDSIYIFDGVDFALKGAAARVPPAHSGETVAGATDGDDKDQAALDRLLQQGAPSTARAPTDDALALAGRGRRHAPVMTAAEAAAEQSRLAGRPLRQPRWHGVRRQHSASSSDGARRGACTARACCVRGSYTRLVILM